MPPRAVTRRGPYEKSRARLVQIGQVAYELVVEHGHAQLTLAEVMRRTGLTEAQLLNLMPSRDHLLLAALEHAESLQQPQWSAPPRAPFDPEALIAEAANDGVREPQVVRLFVAVFAAAGDPAHPARPWVQAHRRRAEERFAEMLEQLQDAGWAHPDVPPEDFARQLLSLWDGLRGRWLVDPTFDLGAQVAAGLRALARHDAAQARRTLGRLAAEL
jgi:AcrR family transcriptional regulator